MKCLITLVATFLILNSQFSIAFAAAPAPTPKTGQTFSYYARDDGALQPGVAWPSTRFTNTGDGTVTDNLTGLVWLKNPGCYTAQSWNAALGSANTLADGICGPRWLVTGICPTRMNCCLWSTTGVTVRRFLLVIHLRPSSPVSIGLLLPTRAVRIAPGSSA